MKNAEAIKKRRHHFAPDIINEKGIYKCPCCYNFTIRSLFDYCEVCSWQYDGYSALLSGPNPIPIEEARENYITYKNKNPYIDKSLRDPLPEELPCNNKEIIADTRFVYVGEPIYGILLVLNIQEDNEQIDDEKLKRINLAIERGVSLGYEIVYVKTKTIPYTLAEKYKFRLKNEEYPSIGIFPGVNIVSQNIFNVYEHYAFRARELCKIAVGDELNELVIIGANSTDFSKATVEKGIALYFNTTIISDCFLENNTDEASEVLSNMEKLGCKIKKLEDF